MILLIYWLPSIISIGYAVIMIKCALLYRRKHFRAIEKYASEIASLRDVEHRRTAPASVGESVVPVRTDLDRLLMDQRSQLVQGMIVIEQEGRTWEGGTGSGASGKDGHSEQRMLRNGRE